MVERQGKTEMADSREGKQSAKSVERSGRALRPTKLKMKPGTTVQEQDEGGPMSWLASTLESAYSQIVPRGAAPPPAGVAMASSVLQPTAASVLAPAGPTVWRDLYVEYKH